MAVRFGNVIGSSGSVIPIFQAQIEKGLPVTVTHPEIPRYFMSIPEAAQLILQAGAMGEGGEIFILDMGKPVKIADMARDLIRLHGLEPDMDIPIQFTGLRPGEKLYEELITEGEGVVPTTHEKIMVLRPNGNRGASPDLVAPASRQTGAGSDLVKTDSRPSAPSPSSENSCAAPLSPAAILQKIDELIAASASFDPATIKSKLKEIVPEYTPQ